MNRFTCLILITFIESVSLAMAGIGVYFYTHEILVQAAGGLAEFVVSSGCPALRAGVNRRVPVRSPRP